MSKARRPRHQRHGSKPTPNARPAAPAAEATPDVASPPEPVAPAPLDKPAAFAAIESSSAGNRPEPSPEHLPDTLPAPSPGVSPQGIAPHEALPQDAAEPAPSPLPIPAPTLAPATVRFSAEALGTTIMNYFIGEGEAMGAHWRALSGARSMAEVVRLQIGEFQRAADATLTCWGMLTLAASRTVAPR